MKRTIVVVMMVVAAVLSGAPIVQADAPLNGTYKSSSGHFYVGRSATSWAAPDGRLQLLNTLNIESWDGFTLNTEWNVCGMQIINVELIADLVFFGNGQKIYLITYTGGMVWLDGGGIWGNGDPDYTGIIDLYVETRTIQYGGGVITGANSNHTINAHLLDYETGCLVYEIGNGVLIGDTDPGSSVPSTKPGGYPPYMAVSSPCTPTSPSGGRWGNVTGLTLTVQGCAVPVEEMSWGAVKALYE